MLTVLNTGLNDRDNHKAMSLISDEPGTTPFQNIAGKSKRLELVLQQPKGVIVKLRPTETKP